MAEYELWKETYFRSRCAGEYVDSETKYHCELKNALPPPYTATHPYTDTNPQRLFRQIASFANKTDIFKTIDFSSISCDNGGLQVTLSEPLNSDELRMLSIEVLSALGNKEADKRST